MLEVLFRQWSDAASVTLASSNLIERADDPIEPQLELVMCSVTELFRCWVHL
jgi:hypothetical protein